MHVDPSDRPTEPPRPWLSHLFRPVDAAGLAAFRVLFGLLMLASTARFFIHGWIDRVFIAPPVHLKYWGLGWVQAGPAWWMYTHFALLALLSVLIALGLFYRVAIVLFLLGFTYVHLIDVTLYLNHDYLVALLALLLAFLPAHRTFSLDARLRPAVRRATVPALAIYALRFQVGLVYLGAALAKIQTDWLLQAQPLRLWLSSLTDLPGLGPLLALPLAPLVASWGGLLFDATIVLWLSVRRTRPFAFAAVVLFHALTALFFPIGMFPVIMIVAATVFFSPSWPRRLRWWAAPAMATAATPAPATWSAEHAGPQLALAALGVFVVVQTALPFRHLLYGGNVLWDEQGMRFSWRVMVREKNGSLTYHVRAPATGRTWEVSPRAYLRDHQERDMCTQPDLIWQLAQRIGRDFDRRGHGRVEVRAEAHVALNGRPAALLLDPGVDLRTVADGWRPKRWIRPAPAGPQGRPRAVGAAATKAVSGARRCPASAPVEGPSVRASRRAAT
jgi:vitamin K-dependent gamma-carboxylase